jgi:hypothetical protein
MGSSTGLAAIRGPPKRASLARIRSGDAPDVDGVVGAGSERTSSLMNEV